MVTMNPAPATTHQKGNLYQIPITDFKLDPAQPRKVVDPDALAELAVSIAKFGILQPLLFREAEQGWVYIVAGERRFQAAQQAGLLVIPAICVTGDYAEIALIENLQRQDLTIVEEAEALQRLKDEKKYTDEQLSGVIGKARQTVSDILNLNRLPLDIRDKCRGDRQISRRTLIDISRKKQERAMITAYNAYMDNQNQVKGSPPSEERPERPRRCRGVGWAGCLMLCRTGTQNSVCYTDQPNYCYAC
ncbi:MAG: ParB/RepB/Spo0J family partition protein [Syntrophales bacterium]|jgi:ParB family chromosome partitioning protein|nr:ParB/RepB/Spo0J family partition protein [Syntrophales bacterium]